MLKKQHNSTLTPQSISNSGCNTTLCRKKVKGREYFMKSTVYNTFISQTMYPVTADCPFNWREHRKSPNPKQLMHIPPACAWEALLKHD
jgi:hypothetical protein